MASELWLGPHVGITVNPAVLAETLLPDLAAGDHAFVDSGGRRAAGKWRQLVILDRRKLNVVDVDPVNVKRPASSTFPIETPIRLDTIGFPGKGKYRLGLPELIERSRGAR